MLGFHFNAKLKLGLVKGFADFNYLAETSVSSR